MKSLINFCVLYADDNEDAREMVTFMLEQANIKVTALKTVTEAWRLARTEDFDLYLLESCFPDGNGLDLCRQLRESFPETAIVFYSASAYETDKQAGLLAGANIYLTKPYLGDLAETILQTVELSKRSDRGSSDKSFLDPQKSSWFGDIYESV